MDKGKPVIRGDGFEMFVVDDNGVANGKVIIEIDLSAPARISASGKTMVVASTRGNVEVPGTDGLVIGLNAYRKRVG